MKRHPIRWFVLCVLWLWACEVAGTYVVGPHLWEAPSAAVVGGGVWMFGLAWIRHRRHRRYEVIRQSSELEVLMQRPGFRYDRVPWHLRHEWEHPEASADNNYSVNLTEGTGK